MAAIGPTAFYTGEVWARHGMSHPELTRVEGRVLHAMTQPTFMVSRLLGGPTLDGMLLGRHLVIDAMLEQAIADGRVGQVLEVAAGMSPRGWRFTERHPELPYVEGDLADMAARQRAALAGMLSAFVRSPVGVHFASEAEARDALRTAGFASISVGLASEHREGQGLNGAERVRIVRATIG